MVELADTAASKAAVREGVRVRVPLRALIQIGGRSEDRRSCSRGFGLRCGSDGRPPSGGLTPKLLHLATSAMHNRDSFERVRKS